jgi:hypothetical protein
MGGIVGDGWMKSCRCWSIHLGGPLTLKHPEVDGDEYRP